jgi:hypothetical protein
MATQENNTNNAKVKGLSTGPGAGDNNAGGGNATGAADPDTALRTDAVNKGDKDEDRKKLFPDNAKPK